MPKILERLVRKVEKQGNDKSSAFAIATAALQKHGYIKHGSQELTEKGKRKNRRS